MRRSIRRVRRGCQQEKGIWRRKWLNLGLLCKDGNYVNYESGHNYCGPKKFEAHLTSGVAPGVLFNPACVYHDLCYGGCWKDKGGCDSEFKNIMMKHCDGIKSDAPRKTMCRANAEAYYQALSKGLTLSARTTAQGAAVAAGPAERASRFPSNKHGPPRQSWRPMMFLPRQVERDHHTPGTRRDRTAAA